MAGRVELSVVAKNQASKVLKQVGGDIRGLSKEAGNAKSSFNDMFSIAGGNLLSRGIQSATSAVMGLGKAFVGTIADAANASAQMNAQVSGIGAVLGLTQTELVKVKDLINQLGVDPNLKVNAQEAADAIDMLARNGLTLEQILGGAAEATVFLANATGGTFATSANVATDVMAMFKIRAEDMMTAVDGITSVTTASKFSIDDYRLALAQAGGVASALGVEFDDFNTSIAATSSSFASGSDGGTSFKTFLQRLVPQSNEAADAMAELGLYTFNSEKAMTTLGSMGIKPLSGDMNTLITQLMKGYAATHKVNLGTEEGLEKFNAWAKEAGFVQNSFYDATGQLKSMADVSAILNQATAGLTEEQKNQYLTTIFGSDAMRTAFGLAEKGQVVYTDVAKAAQELGVSQADLAKYAEGGITAFEALQVTMGKTDALAGAQMRMNNLAGDMEIFWGIVDSVRIQIGDKFDPVLRGVFQGLTATFTQMMPQILAFGDIIANNVAAGVERLSKAFNVFKSGGSIADIGKALGISPGVITVIQTVIEHIDILKGALRGMAAAIGAGVAIAGVTAAITGLLNPITLVIAGAALLGAAWETNFGGIQEKTQAVIDFLRPGFEQLFSWITAAAGGDFSGLQAGLQGALQSVSATIEAFSWSDFITGIMDWGAYITALDWTAIITTAIDWATWIPALSWAGFITAVEWSAYIVGFAWSSFIAILDWATATGGGIDWATFVSALTWENVVAALDWATYVVSFTWDSFITKLEWTGTVAKLENWASYIPALSWADVVTVLSDWGAYITALDWTSIITTAIDWATWIVALPWNTFIAALDWTVFLAGFAWSNYISQIDWSGSVQSLSWDSFVTALSSWATYVTSLPWGSYVTALADWGNFIAAITWASFVANVNWPSFIEGMSWSSFVGNVDWSTWISAIEWAGFVAALAWSIFIPSLSWSSFVPYVDLSSYIPSFPGWGAVFGNLNPFGGSDTPGQNASGTDNWKGGWTWVGEKGPELLNLPKGSQILSNTESKKMIGQLADGTTTAAAQKGGGNVFSVINAAAANMGRAGDKLSKAGQVISDSIKDLEANLRKVPGLFGSSQVTEQQMKMGALGIPQNFADDWLRRLTDEVVNGVNWEGVDIKDAALRAGLDPALPAEAILELVTQKWNDKSLFANPANLDLINQDAVKAALEAQAQQAAGEQNLLGLFGVTPEQARTAGTATGTAAGGGMLTGITQSLTNSGAGQQVATSIATGVTPESMAPVGGSVVTALATELGKEEYGAQMGAALAGLFTGYLDKADAFADVAQRIMSKIAAQFSNVGALDMIARFVDSFRSQLGSDEAIASLTAVGEKILELVFRGYLDEALRRNWAEGVNAKGDTSNKTTTSARNAIGTSSWRGGLTMVGETGPELVSLPPRTRIFNPAESLALAGAGGGDVYVTINATVADGIDVQQMAYRVADILRKRR